VTTGLVSSKAGNCFPGGQPRIVNSGARRLVEEFKPSLGTTESQKAKSGESTLKRRVKKARFVSTPLPGVSLPPLCLAVRNQNVDRFSFQTTDLLGSISDQVRGAGNSTKLLRNLVAEHQPLGDQVASNRLMARTDNCLVPAE
jgi:hypothetical protein